MASSKLKDLKLRSDRMRELSEEFLKSIYALPDGEKIKTCIQCGTCSGSCTAAHVMDFTPREIVAALRAGMLDKVLSSNTIWLCTSCYYCTVRCPQQIKFTDFMYELKRLAVKYELYPKSATAPVLSKTFIDYVDKYGRNPEPLLLTSYYFRIKKPWKMLSIVPLGLKMIARGRFYPFPKKIKGVGQLKKIVSKICMEETSK